MIGMHGVREVLNEKIDGSFIFIGCLLDVKCVIKDSDTYIDAYRVSSLRGVLLLLVRTR